MRPSGDVIFTVVRPATRRRRRRAGRRHDDGHRDQRDRDGHPERRAVSQAYAIVTGCARAPRAVRGTPACRARPRARGPPTGPAALGRRPGVVAVEKRQITEVAPRVRRVRIERDGLLVLTPRVHAVPRGGQEGAPGVVGGRRGRSVEHRTRGVGGAERGKPPVAPDAREAFVRGRIGAIDLRRAEVVVVGHIENSQPAITVGHGTVRLRRRRHRQPQQRRGQARDPGFRSSAAGSTPDGAPPRGGRIRWIPWPLSAVSSSPGAHRSRASASPV